MEPVSTETDIADAHEARWRGMQAGITPLLCLTLVVAAALGFATVVRAVLASQGFFVEQQTEIIVLVTGDALAGVVYVTTLVRALRRIGQWQRAGQAAEASAALATLAATVVLVALPVILAFLIPQHPAP